jgi:hypothetical protein
VDRDIDIDGVLRDVRRRDSRLADGRFRIDPDFAAAAQRVDVGSDVARLVDAVFAFDVALAVALIPGNLVRVRVDPVIERNAQVALLLLRLWAESISSLLHNAPDREAFAARDRAAYAFPVAVPTIGLNPLRFEGGTRQWP